MPLDPKIPADLKKIKKNLSSVATNATQARLRDQPRQAQLFSRTPSATTSSDRPSAQASPSPTPPEPTPTATPRKQSSRAWRWSLGLSLATSALAFGTITGLFATLASSLLPGFLMGLGSVLGAFAFGGIIAGGLLLVGLAVTLGLGLGLRNKAPIPTTETKLSSTNPTVSLLSTPQRQSTPDRKPSPTQKVWTPTDPTPTHTTYGAPNQEKKRETMHSRLLFHPHTAAKKRTAPPTRKLHHSA